MIRTPIRSDRPSDAIAPYFEFCVHARPVSTRAHDRRRLSAWKNHVLELARATWPQGTPPLTVAVQLRIAHYSEKRFADMDNLIKPIQDASQGLAYLDDSMVSDVTENWRDIRLAMVRRP